MRFDSKQFTTALQLINTLEYKDLSSLIYKYGEDPNANRITRAIIKSRPIVNAEHLTEIIQKAVPRRGRKTNPATRTDCRAMPDQNTTHLDRNLWVTQ